MFSAGCSFNWKAPTMCSENAGCGRSDHEQIQEHYETMICFAGRLTAKRAPHSPSGF